MTIGEFLQRCHALSSVYQWLVALTSRSTLVADLVSESSTRRLVLEAFDTLFNKRDYAAAERYWSPHYIQHSNHIEPGREGLFNLIKSIPPTLKYKPGVILAGGDFVIVHRRSVRPANVESIVHLTP